MVRTAFIRGRWVAFKTRHMKRILTLLFLLNISVLFSQDGFKNIIGEWKIVSINSDDFYLNVKTDSTWISEEFKELFSDSSEIENVFNVARMTYNNNVMEFSETGGYTQKVDGELRMIGTYEIKPSLSKIILLLKDKVNLEMNYEIVDDQLRLKSSLYGKESTYILERI